MIDGVKLSYHVTDVQYFIDQHSQLLKLGTKLDVDAVVEYNIGHYRHLEFKLYPSGRLIIKGSLHKYYTNGINYNDFKYSQIVEAILDLKSTFGFCLDRLRILNMEFSVNVIPCIPSRMIIKGIMFYKGRGSRLGKFVEDPNVKGLKTCRLSQAYIKIYDKKSQVNHLKNELMKIEIKYMRNSPISAMGITNVSDLLNKQLSTIMSKALLNMLKGLFIYDHTMDDKYLDCANESKWEKIAIEKHRNTLRNGRKKLNQLSKKYGCSIIESLSKSVDEKLCNLNDLVTRMKQT